MEVPAPPSCHCSAAIPQPSPLSQPLIFSASRGPCQGSQQGLQASALLPLSFIAGFWGPPRPFLNVRLGGGQAPESWVFPRAWGNSESVQDGIPLNLYNLKRKGWNPQSLGRFIE